MIIRPMSKSNFLFPEFLEPLAVNLHTTWCRVRWGAVPEDVAHVVQESGGREQ